MTTWHEDNVQVLPPGAGSAPWLPAEPVEVPVCAAGDYSHVIGKARVYASDDGALMADVTFLDSVNPEKFDHQYGVDGQVVEETVRDGVRKVERVKLVCLAVSAVPATRKP